MSDFTSHETIIREAKALPVMLTGKLVGRDGELSEVYGNIKSGRVVMIHGPAGSGKTALAATLSLAYAQQAGGVLWMNVKNPRLEELLVRVGRAYGIAEITNSDNPLGMIGAVENAIKSNKPLVVIDGEIDPDVASRFIGRCVKGIPAIIIGEQKLEGSWSSTALDKLDADEGAALFKREARLPEGQFDIDIYGISKLVDHLPFGEIVTARALIASKQTPDVYSNLLRQISKASGGNSPIVGLTASFRALNTPLQGLILMMGATFNGQASGELLSAVSNAPLETVNQAMSILSQLHLIERTQRYDRPYYQMHPIMYDFTQSWLKGSNRLEGLQEKMRNAVVAYAQNYGDGQPGNYSKLAAEMDTFMATARWAEKLGDNSIATEIVVALDGAGDFINTCGYLYEQMELRALSSGTPQAFPAYQPEEELPLEASGFEEDMLDEDFDVDDDSERLEAIFISNVEEDDTGQVRVPVSEIVDLDTNDLAKLRSALAEVKQSGDSVQQIKVLKTIGSVQIEQDAEIEALATYSELLNTYETLDDDEGKLDAIDMLSSLLVKTDNPQAAVMHATRGVKLAHDLGDEDTQTQILITLGDAHQQLGEGGKAVENYSDALSMTRSRNDAQNEAIALYKLGYAQLDDGDPDTAIHTWEQALQLFRKHNKRNYESRVLGGLGSAHSDLQHWPEAVNYHSSALHIAREVGNSEEEALQLSSLAYAALQAEQLGEAVLRYRQALHLAYESEDEDTIISTIVALARLLLRSRRHVSVAELIVNDGLELERTDKELYQLKERIIKDKVLANSQGLEMIEVHGTARTYALNAYKLLGE